MRGRVLLGRRAVRCGLSTMDNDAWMLALRALTAAVKLVPTTRLVPITADLTRYVPEGDPASGRTLQDEINDGVVRRDELYWDKGKICFREYS